MHRPAHDEVPGLWEIEGSLRDAYVAHSDISDWQKFTDFVSSYPSAYTFDGETCALPSVDAIFSNRSGGHLLRVKFGAATANCHFFVESEIELDLDPREIQSANTHNEALSFLEGLAVAIGKPVAVTPENDQSTPFLSFDPISSHWHVYS